MKKVLVLGAGLMARPLVEYLSKDESVQVKVIDINRAKAEAVCSDRPNCTADALDINDPNRLNAHVGQCRVAVSLLPWPLHPKVAAACVERGVHLVTTSYVKPEMKALDQAAKSRNLVFLNEIGADPGIDHMSSARMIREVKSVGGQVEKYRAYGTSLPAPASNTNPLGYKFSWSPEGFFLASVAPGRYLEDGHVREVEPADLFSHYRFVEIPDLGTFEAFVNRDALPYMDLYDIASASCMYRGTLRYPGSCETWQLFKKLGLFDNETVWDFSMISPKELLGRLAGCGPGDLEQCLCRFLNIPAFSVFIHKLKWLGLFDEKRPVKQGRGTAMDMFSQMLQKRLAYKSQETDLLVLHHEIEVRFSDGATQTRTATLAMEGAPGGDSATSRAVALPAAVAARLILEGKIPVTGVHIPIIPEIYEPVLTELETLGISLKEKKSTSKSPDAKKD